MGGSTVIHAVHYGLETDGVILLDPQLDIRDSLMRGGQVTTSLPAGLFSVAVSSAICQYHLPSGRQSPLVMAQKLALPILLIQDWDDPVTRSLYAAALAETNPNVSLAKVPAVDLNASCLEGKGAWGSHVAAHPCHPEWTRTTVSQFLEFFID